MKFLKSISRYMERNQAASRAMIKQFDAESIVDMDGISHSLWLEVKESNSSSHCLMIFNDQIISLEFIVKLLIKMGFDCEHAIRMMMALHNDGRVVVAKAEKHLLIELQEYMNAQAKKHGVNLLSEVVEI